MTNTTDFSHNFEFLQFISFKMLYCVCCGLIVGLERKLHDASAGFKTQILVCVGSMLFTVVPLVSHLNMASESARVIGQIVTGVGFLGAGAIMHGHGRDHVVGLTTAAWIWFVAAIGILIGLDFGPAATFVTISLVLVIGITRKIERTFFTKHNHHQKPIETVEVSKNK